MLGVQIALDFPRETRVPVVEPAPTAPRARPSEHETLSRSASEREPLEHPLPSDLDRPAGSYVAGSDARSLEAALRNHVAVPLRLTITDNRRTMISLRKRPEFVEVRLHHMFLQADAHTRDALADYLFESDRHAAQLIGRFIQRHRQRIRRASVRKPNAVSTAGLHHDLAEIYGAVNRRYFDGLVDAKISWGRDPQLGRARRSIKLGSYTAGECLIRVHPALDAAFVPRFFVEYIVYHEMLHHVLPARLQRGRRDLHGPTFKARERQFAEYDAALRWEEENLDRLLSRHRRPRTCPV